MVEVGPIHGYLGRNCPQFHVCCQSMTYYILKQCQFLPWKSRNTSCSRFWFQSFLPHILPLHLLATMLLTMTFSSQPGRRTVRRVSPDIQNLTTVRPPKRTREISGSRPFLKEGHPNGSFSDENQPTIHQRRERSGTSESCLSSDETRLGSGPSQGQSGMISISSTASLPEI